MTEIKKKKIVILGCKNLAVLILKRLISEGYNVIGVVVPISNKLDNNYLRDYCLKNNVQILDYDNAFLLNPDIIFSINYWKLIEKKYIDNVPLGIINIHHSYRLMYGGRYITSFAIMNSDKISFHGTTMHYIDEKFDQGHIIDTRKCNIESSDTAYTLFNKVEKIAFDMFFDNLDRVLDSKVTSTISLFENPTFFSKDMIEKKELKLPENIKKMIDLQTRAWTYPDTEPPYILYKGHKIYLTLQNV